MIFDDIRETIGFKNLIREINERIAFNTDLAITETEPVKIYRAQGASQELSSLLNLIEREGEEIIEDEPDRLPR
jgi:hypothetical protein